MKMSYYILLFGTVICLYYQIMLGQVASTTDTPILTSKGQSVFPLDLALTGVILIACIVPLILQVSKGIVSDRRRYAQVDSIPWGFVVILSVYCAAGLGILTCVMRILAEIQLVGIESVAWAGDIAMGVVFFGMAFVLSMILTAVLFNDAIKNRKKLEVELDEE